MNIYTNLEEAKKEIWNRWNNKELRKKVEEYLGNDIPQVFLNEPRAVLFRNIISPDFEFLYFLESAKRVGLKPLGLEYVEDFFCTRNSDKLGLCKLNIFDKRDKNGDVVIRYNKIVDLMSSDNKKFCDIKLKDGQNLTEFHRRLLGESEGVDLEIFDMSQWIKNNGQKAIEYYKKFLAFFICHGVFFENFVTDESEAEFENNVILPAIDAVKKDFDIQPIVVALVKNPKDSYWWCYPNNNISEN